MKKVKHKYPEQFEAINLVEIPKMEYPKLKNRRHFWKDI